ncbi:E3 ubiquitin-protein ligase CHFR [Pygocentrus nattereri]|uniref:E3 ubiquitin-protein ligase CHFR n=1 Tax=Pygocentrus nattereri TaxID=42514 RepID=A0AAR2JGT5_PYGNA|nr:E3 ubiquitin-protein ligase CHFR [Pygocentrus nattereri]XP_037387861.1 E3 ubiquitin-protein ligase CHFR [Pygocentrus nattereri]XP_037387862.1 E3 ubiquitin-protein ligase CHFR [Pygocentrus nattereri]
MDPESRGQPWGKLVRVGASPQSELTLLLTNRECTIGRRKGCDLSFPANKLVSGDHCKITQDQTSGQVWLEDMSTNGTVINMSKLVKKQSHLLQNGDVIYFVYRKSEPEQNIAYVYQAISPKQTDSQETEDTVRNSCSAVMDRVDTDVDPAPVEPVTLPSFLLEKPLRPGYEDQPSTSSSGAHLYPTLYTHTVAATSYGDVTLTEPSVIRHKGPECSTGVSTPKSLTLKQTREMDEEAGPDRKRQRTDGPHELSSSISDSAAPAKTGKDGEKTDKMEESLTCIICQDLLHDCVSLQPCMHTFCAACYSGWMERSSLCPTCRCPVERIRKNHILNNLVEAYLQQHPEKCRSEEDLRSMDARNKITQDMLQPKVERSFSDEEGSSDYLFELSDNDSDTSDMSQPYMTCRQCPGYRKDFSPAPWICSSSQEEGAVKAPGDGPSTSTDTCTGPQEFRCPPQGGHLICTCCLQPMPDRRSEHVGPQGSPQHCMVCQRPFCHLYWGCQRIGCQGCLARFSDLNLTAKCLDGVLNNNNYESEILQNYLTSRGKTWREMLQEALQAIQQGLYHLTDYRINASSLLCYCCGLRFFKELAYKYRENIPASDLPAAVTSRPDCYWGRNCRTQVKAHHAMKFNHICEQTRFKN